MSEDADSILQEVVEEAGVELPTLSSSEVQLESSLELADRIIGRMMPANRAAVLEMIADKAKFGGGLLTLMAVFWWLAVDMATDNLDIKSIFFGFDFSQVALIVIGLAFLASLLSDISRELGRLVPSLLSGGMVIFSILYIGEPLVMGLIADDLSVNAGLWRSARLGILWAGVTFSAKLVIDACLLLWLKSFCDAQGIEIAPPQDANDSALDADIGSLE